MSQDDVVELFKITDTAHKGKISRSELKVLLSSLDAKMWTDEATDKLLQQIDTNGDGDLQFVEFLSWIGSSTTKADRVYGAIPWNKALAEAREKKACEQEARDQRRREQAEKERLAKEAKERAEQNKSFVSSRVDVGLSKSVAKHQLEVADHDNDGYIDSQELRSFTRYELGTKDQVKGLFQEVAHERELEAEEAGDPAMSAVVDSILKAFSSWDEDGDGVITTQEVGRVFRVLNPSMGQDVIDAVVREADTSGDGYVDVFEFVEWILCKEGGKKKKNNSKAKREKEDREALVSISVNRKRADEAVAAGKVRECEDMMQAALAKWCTLRKVKKACCTLNRNPPCDTECSSCGARHAWLCHGCGFVTYGDSCAQGCVWGRHGWSCITGKCKGATCGCKKPAAFWKRRGCASNPRDQIETRGEVEVAAVSSIGA